MGSEGEIWRAIAVQVKAKRTKNLAAYLELLTASSVPFTITNHGQTLLFREFGKPPVDFYPSTGKWRVAQPSSKTYSGGGKAFLSWYAKQYLTRKTVETES